MLLCSVLVANIRIAISCEYYILIISPYMTFFSAYDNKLTITYVKKNWKFFSQTDEIYHTMDRKSSERQLDTQSKTVENEKVKGKM